MTVEEMYRTAGPNQIPFEVDSWAQALTEEFCTYFFLYQFSIYAVCVWFSYWHYTIIAVFIAIISGFFNASVRLASQRSIKSMMEQKITAKVFRDGQVIQINAADLVPGDIVKVQNGPVPCDLLLLRGAAVCDESTLTGESMPVQRLTPAGTTVLQAVDDDTWAMATHTGIHTQKGQLLLLILYPPKLIFKYDEQLSVVFFLLIVYALFVAITLMRVMYWRYANDQHLPITATWASAVFTCSCVLPTMLHIVLSVGQVVSAQRLKQEGAIFCVVPKRIALAGKVRVACFDKTGTLTTSGLEFFGVHCVSSSQGQAGSAGRGPFSSYRVTGNGVLPSLEEEPQSSNWDLEIMCCLASTHSLSPFSGTEAGVVGNAVEVNMFKASRWTLTSQTRVESASDQIDILKRFDFSHNTMTMSAVVQHSPSGEKGIYCKGSFEHVLRLCRPESIPEDFSQVASEHAYSGMYVLAIAARSVEPSEVVATREDAEKNLSLLGLLLFKNPPRSDTAETIERLRAGDVRSVMITGDAAGTAISIAKEIGLALPGLPVLLGDVETDSHGQNIVCWRCSGDDLKGLNQILLGNEWLNWRKNYKQWRGGSAAGARGEATIKAAKNRAREAQDEHELSRPTVAQERRDGCVANTGEEVTDQDFVFSTEEIVLSRLYEWCELAVTQRAFEWLAARQCPPDLRRVLLGSRLSSLKKGKALGSGKGLCLMS
ncbi:Polyamine-transporting ATPase 13A2 [Durusdinium trenchii]|uniref:Polyamine-transporting ATPase 13A2 n=1 Tax=Durusdinium trenchii TaxID=1381693 RepID=A0ABP0KAC5_9DINO